MSAVSSFRRHWRARANASWVAMGVMVKPFCLAPERLRRTTEEGDHWIDISSAEFSFKKNGEGRRSWPI